MHEENTRSTRHSYRASRVPKTQLNVAIENVGKIPRICGGGGGGGGITFFTNKPFFSILS